MPSYSTMSNTSVGGEGVVLKVTLEKNREAQELRRLRGNFTFEEIVSLIRNMWNSAPKRLTIEYVDEDGDRVRVGSQIEWAEAQQQHAERGERVLRLFARKTSRGGADRKQADAQDVSDSDNEASEALPHTRSNPAPAASTPAVPPLWQSNSTTGPHQPQQQPADQTDASPADGVAGSDEMEAEPTEGTEEHENTIDLLSRLYDCDAAKEMLDMFSRIDFSPIVTRKVDAVRQTVEVDVDKSAMKHLAVAKTNMWIGNGLYEKAEAALEVATRIWPEDPIFTYNAACSASLRGDVPKAVMLLGDAVRSGFRNIQQLKRDPDLAHARDHPDFTEVLRAARGEVTDAETPVPEPAVAPAAPPRAEETDADRLISVFPELTTQEAEGLMRRFGSLQIAVNHVLARR